MATAYQCKCGYKDTLDIKCPMCGSKMKAFQCGPPAKDESTTPSIPYVANDHVAKHTDWALGEEINSKSDRKKKYKAAGLRFYSANEYRRRYGGVGKCGRAITYAGQTSHRSTAERM